MRRRASSVDTAEEAWVVLRLLWLSVAVVGGVAVR